MRKKKKVIFSGIPAISVVKQSDGEKIDPEVS